MAANHFLDQCGEEKMEWPGYKGKDEITIKSDLWVRRSWSDEGGGLVGRSWSDLVGRCFIKSYLNIYSV